MKTNKRSPRRPLSEAEVEVDIDYIVSVKNEELLKGARFRVIDIDKLNKVARIAKIRDTNNSIRRDKKVEDRYDKKFSSLVVLKKSRRAIIEEEENMPVDMASFEI